MIDSTVYSVLVQPNIANLVGGGGFSNGFSNGFQSPSQYGSRIYPAGEPVSDTQYPFIAYSTAGCEPVWILDGPTGTRIYQVAIDVYAFLSFSLCEQIAEAVASALDGYHTSPVKVSKLTGAETTVEERDGYCYRLTFEITAAV
jgi:hypothetical protein